MTSAHFIKNGNTYSVAPKGALVIEDVLPPKTFALKVDSNRGFYLEIVEDFKLPPKVYGNTLKLTDRILYTFLNRENSTGVLLVGEKGSGKTLLAKSLSLEGSNRNIPTIVINSAYTGDQFNSLIQSINQPCIVLFDEFEKTYDSDSQEKILTLLDGVFQSKKLFILTSNDKFKIDVNMRNRPGRVYYLLDFKGLNENFIREYCKDNLRNLAHLEELIKISSLFDTFNFDLLVAFVEEINRYDESPSELLPILNAKPEYCGGSEYEVRSLTFRGIDISLDSLNRHTLSRNNFNLASDEWNIDCTLVFEPKDTEVKNRLTKSKDSYVYDIDFIHDMVLKSKVKFKTPEDNLFSKVRSRLEKISMVSSLGPFDGPNEEEPKGPPMESHTITVLIEPSDIVEYTPNGAVYKSPGGFTLKVKKSKTRRGKSNRDFFNAYD
jgi:GTPase SAR1 family protein